MKKALIKLAGGVIRLHLLHFLKFLHYKALRVIHIILLKPLSSSQQTLEVG